MRTNQFPMRVVVGLAVLVAAAGCSRDLPTGLGGSRPALSVARAPLTFTVGPLGLGGIEILTPGGNLHFRDVLLSGPVSGDLSGSGSITLNADLDGQGNGPVWGTIAVWSGDDEWRGSLTGHFVGALPDGLQLFSRVILHGPGEQLIQAECDETSATSETLACEAASLEPRP